jgi:hypothetical protein
MSILTCVPRNPYPPGTIALLSVVNGLVAIAFVLVTYCFCCRRVSKPVRTFHAMRKRALGMPKSGRMSVVVTDIEGYSGESWFGGGGDGWMVDSFLQPRFTVRRQHLSIWLQPTDSNQPTNSNRITLPSQP